LIITAAFFFFLPILLIKLLCNLYLCIWRKNYEKKFEQRGRSGDDHQANEWYNPDIGKIADPS
jgi:hypothetical protein